MKRDTTRNIKAVPVSSNINLWTVVSVVDDRISCSIHRSEDEAYREAVSRFESIESGGANSRLNSVLAAASRLGHYQEVRKYIENNACRISLMQLAEHSMDDLPSHRVRLPNLTQVPLSPRLAAQA
jgi:hypothetical protein